MEITLILKPSPELETLVGSLIAALRPALAHNDGSKASSSGAKTKTETPAPSQNGKETAITIDMIRAEVRKKADENKKDAVKSLLSEFHVKSVTELDLEQYPLFHKQIQEL